MNKTVTPVALALTDPSLVGEARRLFAQLGLLAGLGADACSRVALVTTELATNLVKHAREGELLGRAFSEGGRAGIEITSVDRGPGMDRPEDCFRDGYSTAGSPGTGLGAVRRLASSVETYSLLGTGTVIVARILAGDAPPSPIETGLVLAPAPRENVCGDAISFLTRGPLTTVLAVDGLGHGVHAAAAANEAVRVFHEDPASPLPDLVRRLHAALQKTRGAALALARIDHEQGTLDHCGVGNITATIARQGASKILISPGGIVGHMLPNLKTSRLAWEKSDTLIMHSDGLHSTGKALTHPGLLVRHPAVLAGMLYAEQKRGRDDASVIVLRPRSDP
jgi:anti-sigma regulatory factor (Ser/Thr protein kinase)